MIGLGFAEFFILIAVFGHSLGVPVGVPPTAEQPEIFAVAPEQCLAYAAWNGTDTPDPNATNPTERWMARERILRWAQKIRTKFTRYVQTHSLAESPNEKALADLMLQLADESLFHSSAMFIETTDSIDALAGGFIVHVGEEPAAKWAAEFERLNSLMPAEWQPRGFDVGSAQFFAFTIPDVTYEFSYGVRGSWVVIGMGSGAVERIDQRLKTAEPSWLAELKAALPVARRSSFSHFDIANIMRLVSTSVPDLEDNLGPIGLLKLDSIQAFQSVAGLDDHGFVCRHRLLSDGPLSGLLSILDAPPLTQSQMASLPGDIDLGWCSRFSIEHLLAFTQSLVEFDGEDFDEPFAAFHQQFGLRLKEDFLDKLDGSYTIAAKINVDDPMSGILLMAGVNDEMAFAENFIHFNQKVEEMIAESTDGDLGDVRFSREEVDGVEVLSVKISSPFGISFNPTWCLFDGRVVFSLSTETLQKYIREPRENRLVRTDPDLSGLLADAGAEGHAAPQSIAYLNLRKIIDEVMNFASMFRDPDAPFDIDDFPSAKVLGEGVRPSVTAVYRTDDGLELVVRQTIPGGTPGSTIASMMLVNSAFAVDAMRSRMMTEAKNNLRQILFGMHNYHDAYQGLPPPYSRNQQGQPLLSWRVHILPFIEESNLYEQFHLDEPWDSEHNLKLVEQMPVAYKHPKLELPAGRTVYLAVTGTGAPIQLGKKWNSPIGATLEQMSNLDGTSRTMMLVEANADHSVIWTKPDDLNLDEVQDLLSVLAGTWQRRILVGMGDAVILEISDTIPAEKLRALGTFNDGVIINPEEFAPRNTESDK